MKLLSVVLLCSSLLLQTAHAWPTGAGDCPKGMASVGGSHLTRTVTNSTLEESDFRFLIGVAPVVSGDVVMLSRNDMTIEGGTFKGFLIRIEGPEGVDMDGLVTPFAEDDANVQVESRYCGDQMAGGVTHTNNEDKESVMAAFDVSDQPGEYTIDVTVVVSNSGDESEYYHSTYVVQAGTDSDQPDDAEEEEAVPDEGETHASSSSQRYLVVATFAALLGSVVGSLL